MKTLGSPAARFESRDIYLVRCPDISKHDNWPPVPYFRLVVLASADQLGYKQARRLAESAVASGAYSTVAAGGAAEDIEEAFDAVIREGRYETGGRTYLTAVARDQGLDEVLWESFYTMLGDADIEEDQPPIVILVKDGDALAEAVEEILPRLGEAFKAVVERGGR